MSSPSDTYHAWKAQPSRQMQRVFDENMSVQKEWEEGHDHNPFSLPPRARDCNQLGTVDNKQISAAVPTTETPIPGSNDPGNALVSHTLSSTTAAITTSHASPAKEFGMESPKSDTSWRGGDVWSIDWYGF